MPMRDDQLSAPNPVRRSWQERLIFPILIAGGVLTLTWIVALIGMVWRIVGAVAGTSD